MLRSLPVAIAMALAFSSCSEQSQSGVQDNTSGPGMMGNGMMGNGKMQGTMMGNGMCDNCAEHMNNMMGNDMMHGNMMADGDAAAHEHPARHPK